MFEHSALLSHIQTASLRPGKQMLIIHVHEKTCMILFESFSSSFSVINCSSWFVLYEKNNNYMYVTPIEGEGGTYCFWCGSRLCWFLLHSIYHLNQWVDFDQIGTNTLFGEGKEVINFRRSWHHFQGHTSTLKFPIWQKELVCTIYLLNQMTDSGQTSSIVRLGWFKELVRFWWPWPNFQGHHTLNIVKMSLMSALCLLNQLVNFDQSCIETPFGNGKEMIRFWWPWSHFQGHTSTLVAKKACLHAMSWTKWWILAKLYVLYHKDN